MAKIGKVNEQGMLHLKAWVQATGQPGKLLLNASALNAWAADAELGMGNGNPPLVEMPFYWSKSGRPQEFIIPADGIDWIEVYGDE